MNSETRRIVTGDGQVHEVVIRHDPEKGWDAVCGAMFTFPHKTADDAMRAFVGGFCDVLDIREVVPSGGKTSDERAAEARTKGTSDAIDALESVILSDLGAVSRRARDVPLPHNGTNPEWVRYRSSFATLQTMLTYCGRCRGWEHGP
jgi:hypothetical protein